MLGNRFEYLPELLELGIGHCLALRTKTHPYDVCGHVWKHDVRLSRGCTFLSLVVYRFPVDTYFLSYLSAAHIEKTVRLSVARARTSDRVPRIDYYRFRPVARSRPVPLAVARAPQAYANRKRLIRASGTLTIVINIAVVTLSNTVARRLVSDFPSWPLFSFRRLLAIKCHPLRRAAVGFPNLFIYFFRFFIHADLWTVGSLENPWQR